MSQDSRRDPFAPPPTEDSSAEREANMLCAAVMFADHLSNVWHALSVALGPRCPEVCYDVALAFGHVVSRAFALTVGDTARSVQFAHVFAEAMFHKISDSLESSDISLNWTRFHSDLLAKHQHLNVAMEHFAAEEFAPQLGRVAMDIAQPPGLSDGDAHTVGELLLHLHSEALAFFRNNRADF